MKHIYIDGHTQSSTSVDISLNDKELLLISMSKSEALEAAKFHKKIEKTPDGYILKHGDNPYNTLVIKDLNSIEGIIIKYPYLGLYIEKKNRTVHKLIVAAIVVFVLSIFSIFAIYFWGLDWAAKKVANQIPIEKEAELGKQFFEQYLSTAQVDEPQTQLVDSFFKSLHFTTPYPIKLVVVKSDVVNAFAIPGGYIVVNSAILNTIDQPAELAGLLAHELTHINKKHGTQSMVRELGASILIAMVFGDYNESGAVLVRQIDNLKSLKYGRDMEQEADEIGLQQLDSHTGYSGFGMISLFEELKKESKGNAPPEFLSTHPDMDNRIKNIQQHIKIYKKQKFTTETPDSIFQLIKKK